MNERRHPFFGALTPEADGSFNWESKRDGTQVKLHIDRLAEMKDQALNALAKLYEQFPALERTAREAMKRDYVDPEGAAKMYEEIVRDIFPDSNTDDVLGALVPVRLWSWLEGDGDVWVTLDYSFAPGEMDHVLCARFDESAQVVALNLES
jgi:hypothetical protein